uniref:Uncharacterized protein n=1 Tax=Aquila chrysaetos chrysaetos TaxID=223781 RepID=A0A663F209_AQUCH
MNCSLNEIFALGTKYITLWQAKILIMHLSGLTSGCHSQRDAINLIRSRASVEVGVRLEEQQVRYASLHKNHKVFSLSSCYKNRCGPAKLECCKLNHCF